MEQAQELKKALMAMVDEDAKNFLPLSKAYGLPRETEAEKTARDATLQACLKQACEVPLKIVETAWRAAMLSSELIEKCSKLAISDVGCAAACIRAALTGGWLNAVINLSMIKDAAYVENAEKNIKPLVDEGVGICDGLYEKTLKALKGEQ
jgi:formiminotetrahydrofolate cyclodeaminase